MPELPELQALAEGLTPTLAGAGRRGRRVHHPATLKTVEPPVEALVGRAIDRVWRRGKLLGVAVEGDLHLVIHLMQAGRLGIAPRPAGRPGRQARRSTWTSATARCCACASCQRSARASAHVLDGEGLAAHRPYARLGPSRIGLDPEGWRAVLDGPGVLHTALRDGRRVAGIGRAYASEIMWAAKLAPFARASSLDDEAVARLARARRRRARPGARARPRADHHRHAQQGGPRDRRARPPRRALPALRHAPRARGVQPSTTSSTARTCQTGGRVYRDRRMSRLLG